MNWKFCSGEGPFRRHFAINTKWSGSDFLFDAVKGLGYHPIGHKCNRIYIPFDIMQKIDRGDFISQYAGMNLVEFLLRTFGPKKNGRD
jgi:hypothetical protein